MNDSNKPRGTITRDPELVALDACLEALAPLDSDAVDRIITYLGSRNLERPPVVAYTVPTNDLYTENGGIQLPLDAADEVAP